MNRHSFLRHTLALMAIALPLAAAHAQTVPLFNTGVDAASVPMAGGSSDSHYTFTYDINRAIVLNDQAPGPYVQSPNSRWVWFNANGSNPAGTDTYNIFTEFTLSSLEVASGVTLSGRWATDNVGTVLLNGAPLSSTFDSFGFNTWTPFSVSSGLVAGTNTLTFRVTNDGGSVGGLNVDELQYTVGPASAAPEPGSLALLALGGVGLAARLRRKRG